MKLYGSRCNLEISGKPDIELGYIDGIDWRVPHDILYEIDGDVEVVPKGYVTNMASIPRWLWSVFGPPTGNGPGAAYGLSAILHDYLYDRQLLFGKPVTRRRVDEIFRQDMLWRWVRPRRAWAMWLAVRLFGWRGWNRRGQNHEIIGAFEVGFV